MASLNQHMRDCKFLIGEDCESVNRWMDECFKEYGPLHRFKRHHREGIRQAESIFGDLGRRAATVHILRDCRQIPRESDYSDGTVDKLGLRAKWPVSAYIRYSDDAFERLAMFSLHGPEAVLNVSSFRTREDLAQILRSSRLAGDERRVNAILEQWPAFVEAKENSRPLVEPSIDDLTDAQRQYVEELGSHPLMQSVKTQYGGYEVRLVSPSSLINPLVWIDLEYIEQLRPELTGTDDRDAIKFAVPREVNVSTQVAVDPDMRGVSLVSAQKYIAAMPPLINQVPGVGMMVSFSIVGLPQLILASRVNGKLYLRNGMHRAFLLAASGVSAIPTVIVDERQLTPISTMYPSFNNAVLETELPPFLSDLLNSNFTVNIPIARTQKVIRIHVQDLLIPVD
jgi:hypothetical protein